MLVSPAFGCVTSTCGSHTYIGHILSPKGDCVIFVAYSYSISMCNSCQVTFNGSVICGHIDLTISYI
jgi:hypothetical protein